MHISSTFTYLLCLPTVGVRQQSSVPSPTHWSPLTQSERPGPFLYPSTHDRRRCGPTTRRSTGLTAPRTPVPARRRLSEQERHKTVNTATAGLRLAMNGPTFPKKRGMASHEEPSGRWRLTRDTRTPDGGGVTGPDRTTVDPRSLTRGGGVDDGLGPETVHRRGLAAGTWTVRGDPWKGTERGTPRGGGRSGSRREREGEHPESRGSRRRAREPPLSSRHGNPAGR